MPLFGIDKDKIKAAFAAFEANKQTIEDSKASDDMKLTVYVQNINKFIEQLKAAFS